MLPGYHDLAREAWVAMSTFFVALFAVACLAMFGLAWQKEWRTARIVSAAVAIVSFALALFAVSVHR